MSTIPEIKNTLSHRPFPLPERSWKYYQEWEDTIFLHYKVPQQLLSGLVPKELSLDNFEGEAWVSIVAFTVKNMRLKYLPPLPYLSEFNEINLRTYVVNNGIPGIYFLTIETEKISSVLLANTLIGLDYKKARVKRSINRYMVSESAEENQLSIKYLSLPELHDKTELDKWLTERYCAYELINGQMYKFNIHHKPWPLKDIKLRKLDICYRKDGFIIKDIKPDLQHFSSKQEVLLWGREKS